jgi:hypothetical protein
MLQRLLNIEKSVAKQDYCSNLFLFLMLVDSFTRIPKQYCSESLVVKLFALDGTKSVFVIRSCFLTKISIAIQNGNARAIRKHLIALEKIEVRRISSSG